MATNHTQNYQLNLWEPGDAFLRSEFNENTQILDAALKAEADARAAGDAALTQAVNGKADASAVTALTQTVNGKASTTALNALTQTVAGKGNCTIVTGSYVGTGTYGKNNPTSLDFAATVGKPPLLLFVFSEDGVYNLQTGRNMGKCPSVYAPDYILESWCYFTWTPTGVRWYSESTAARQLNGENVTYHYIAIF